MSIEKTVSVRNIYEGSILKLDVHEVLLENQKAARREIITHSGGVGILPITKDGRVILVKQFRKPFEGYTLEIPAGKKEKGEELVKCAARELSEETGITAEKMTFLVEMYPSPGYTNETVCIYLAEGLTYGEAAPDEDEFVEVLVLSLDEAYELIRNGGIKDAKTVIAITMAVNERLIRNF